MFGYLALLARIVVLGYERIATKQLSEGAESVSSAFLIFSIGTLMLAPFILLVEPPANYTFLVYVAASSFVYSIAFIFYVRALSTGEASLVTPLYNFNVFFLLVLAATFLGETITLSKVGGLILLVYGASFLNKQGGVMNSLRALFRSKECVYMMLCSMLIAVGRTVDGFAVQSVHPLTYGFALYLGISMFLFMYVVYGRKTHLTSKLVRKKPRYAVLAGAANAFSYLFLLFAFTYLEVSVAEPASMLNVLVTIVLAHYVFKESVKMRLIGALIMVVGAWLLLHKI
jgi:transporter family protein